MFGRLAFSKKFKELETEVSRLRAKHSADLEDRGTARTGQLLALYTRLMTKALDAERCSVFILDPRREQVWIKTGTGVEEHQIEVPEEGSIVGKVIASGRPIASSDLEGESGVHKEIDQETGFVTRNVLCVPIKSTQLGEVVGAFEVLNKKNDQNFTDDDTRLAEEVAEQMQHAVEKVFLHQEIYRVSNRIHAGVQAIKTAFLLILGIGVLAILAWIIYVVVALTVGLG